MDLLESILGAQNGGMVQQLAQNFGIGENQASSAITALLPALTGAMQNNISQEGGLESLLGALSGGGHQRYVDDLSTVATPESIQDGNGILGHLLGSKDVSRQVARAASSQTGLGEGLLKQMLPVVATLLMGQLSKRAAGSGLQNAPSASGGGDMMGMLSGMLDFNRDGSPFDDILGIAGKFLGGR